MDDSIDITAVYDKSLNFLIGSGASADLFPTLALSIKDDFEEAHTLETLATTLEHGARDDALAWLFMHYYSTCIKPAVNFREEDANTPKKRAVLENYEAFLRTVLHILQRRKSLDRRCNIFTTNYDGCLAYAADRILSSGTDDFTLNDGARGFRRRVLQAQNFNTFLCQSGVFERSLNGIPQVNLIHLHGSVYWKKADTGIEVDYHPESEDLVPVELNDALAHLADVLHDDQSHTADFRPAPMAPQFKAPFLERYKKLPIISPTKWKFQETLFEEHYYQMLRLLSYELEKPGAVLITFGFSFADEHILSLVKRSLSNPQLQVFVCCYSEAEKLRLSATFRQYPNVKCISTLEGVLSFSTFNDRVFSLSQLRRQATGEVATGPAAPALAPAAEAGG